MTIFLTVKRYTAIFAGVVTISAIVFTISLAACSFGGNEDIHARIYRKYSEIQSFSAVLEVTVTTEKTENTYTVKQYYAAPDKFREDILSPETIAGMTYIFANGTISIFPPVDCDGISMEIDQTNRNYTFIPEFFERYFNSDYAIIAVSVDDSTDDITTVLEVILDGNNFYRASQKLWICNQTAQPLKLKTFNSNGDVLISAIFIEFNLNDRIDGDLFETTATRLDRN